MTRAWPRWTWPSTASWRPAAGPAWWSTRPPGPRAWPAPGGWTRPAKAVTSAYKELDTYGERFAEPLVLEADARFRHAAGEPGAEDLLARATERASAGGAHAIAAASRPRPSACSPPREVDGLGQGREVFEDLVEAVVAVQAEDHLMGPGGAGGVEVVRHLIDGAVIRRAARGAARR